MAASRTLLVIDDEADIREIAQASLELIGGYTVLLAASGREGLELAARCLPDAILLDVMMPDLDGPTVFGELQSTKETQSIPVLFLTAKVKTLDRARLAKLGAAAVITKPFDPMMLAGQVAASLGWNSD